MQELKVKKKRKQGLKFNKLMKKLANGKEKDAQTADQPDRSPRLLQDKFDFQTQMTLSCV